jgi:hypothetical protein
MNQAQREQQARNLAKILFDLARSDNGLSRIYAYLLQTGEPEETNVIDNLVSHFPTILDIIDAGLASNREQVRDYAQLLLERIESDRILPEEQRNRLVGYLHQVLSKDGKHDQNRMIGASALASEWRAAHPVVQAHAQAHPFVPDSDELRGVAIEIASEMAEMDFGLLPDTAWVQGQQADGAYDVVVIIDASQPGINCVWRVKDGQAVVVAEASESDLARFAQLGEKPEWMGLRRFTDFINREIPVSSKGARDAE